MTPLLSDVAHDRSADGASRGSSAAAVAASPAASLAASPAASLAASPAASLAASLAAVAPRWLSRIEYRGSSRWTALLPADDVAHLLGPATAADVAADVAGAQVWLLTWLPGQGTPLHDHGGSAGAFAVVCGALTEDTVGGPAGAVREVSAELPAGRVRPFGPHHVHRVTNRGDGAAVSVHAYIPGLRQMTTYALADGVLLSTGTERAGVDW